MHPPREQQFYPLAQAAQEVGLGEITHTLTRTVKNGYNYNHMVRAISITEAKKRLLELIRQADESFERYIISRNGVPKAVLMSIEDYEGWLETLDIASDPVVVREIKKARKELERGRGIPLKRIMEKMGAKI